MDLELAGRRYIVTGGSRGIGRAIVSLLVDEGARVATCARGDPGWGPEEVAPVVAMLLSPRSSYVVGATVDVSGGL